MDKKRQDPGMEVLGQVFLSPSPGPKGFDIDDNEQDDDPANLSADEDFSGAEASDEEEGYGRNDIKQGMQVFTRENDSGEYEHFGNVEGGDDNQVIVRSDLAWFAVTYENIDFIVTMLWPDEALFVMRNNLVEVTVNADGEFVPAK